MNQTEIMKEPRDCFAVLQLFPEPYRQKVRTALELSLIHISEPTRP